MSEVMELVGVVPAPVWSAWEPLALSMLTAGAAALILAALPLVRGGAGRLSRPFSLAALCAGLTGQAALFVSLEQPLRAYEFFAHPSFTSWTAAGAYIVPLFLLAALFMALRTRSPRPAGKVLPWLALAAGAAVFVYATNEIMACVGRALWTSPLLPVAFVAAGLSGGVGLAACLSSSGGGQTLDRTLAGYAALGVAACAVLCLVLPAPAGFASSVSVWWRAPDILCLAAVLAALAGWRRPVLDLASGLSGLAGGFLLFWKLIQMGQAFPRMASTVDDKAAFLDLFSGPSLLALAGTAGLLLALAVLLPALLSDKSIQAPGGAR